MFAAAAAKSLQSCPTLCDPIDGSPPRFPVPGILQARTLDWVAVSFSNAWKWKVKVKSLSRVQLFVTPWTAAYHAPPSMGFPRQEYWSGVPLPSLKGCTEYHTIQNVTKYKWWCFHHFISYYVKVYAIYTKSKINNKNACQITADNLDLFMLMASLFLPCSGR